jgi:hypothetical protein
MPTPKAGETTALRPATQSHERPGAGETLRRDYGNVYGDVEVLTAAGLLSVKDGSVRTDYDAIETKIAL